MTLDCQTRECDDVGPVHVPAFPAIPAGERRRGWFRSSCRRHASATWQVELARLLAHPERWS